MHVMKKTLLAAALVMASGSALAVDGGHIDFNGMVQSGTCKVGVVDTGMHSVTTDGVVTLDTANVTDMSSMFSTCRSLIHVNLKNAKLAYQLSSSALLSKESLLYLINNEAATSAITIKLASYAYTRLANDADIVAALAAHPNISLAK